MVSSNCQRTPDRPAPSARVGEIIKKRGQKKVDPIGEYFLPGFEKHRPALASQAAVVAFPTPPALSQHSAGFSNAMAS